MCPQFLCRKEALALSSEVQFAATSSEEDTGVGEKEVTSGVIGENGREKGASQKITTRQK